MSKDNLITKEQSMEDVVGHLLLMVVGYKLSMRDAEKLLNSHVAGLSEEKAIEFKTMARPFGMRLMSVAEGFLQELTVIGARS